MNIDQLKLFKIWNIFEVKMLPGFSYSKNMANLRGHFIKHKPLISEECGVSVEAENHPRIGRENSRGHFSKMQSFWKSRSISSSAQWARILKKKILVPCNFVKSNSQSYFTKFGICYLEITKKFFREIDSHFIWRVLF